MLILSVGIVLNTYLGYKRECAVGIIPTVVFEVIFAFFQSLFYKKICSLQCDIWFFLHEFEIIKNIYF